MRRRLEVSHVALLLGVTIVFVSLGCRSRASEDNAFAVSIFSDGYSRRVCEVFVSEEFGSEDPERKGTAYASLEQIGVVVLSESGLRKVLRRRGRALRMSRDAMSKICPTGVEVMIVEGGGDFANKAVLYRSVSGAGR
jgi:hypothetical protein